ncbi:hypothetical protein B0H13DRAFT_2345225 [Mycena leptocephala]|nr:hypothetical protein B0H13DRAFT_2345225 [Mycena leptocephala]
MTSVAELTLPMFLGTVLNWALFATFLVQVFFPKDQGWWKLLVIVIVVLECVETFAGLRDMVKIFGVGFGSMDVLDDVGLAWFSSPIIGSIIAGICQIFYGWRIYILGHNLFVFALIILISAVQLGAGIWSGVIVCIGKKYSLLQSADMIPTALWLAATATADLIIAFGTIFYLARSRGDPEFASAKTNSLVSRLVQRTAETGILCALVALVGWYPHYRLAPSNALTSSRDVMLFATFTGKNYHLVLCLVISKVYSNSILFVRTASITLKDDLTELDQCQIFISRAHMGYECSNSDTHLGVNTSSSVFRARAPTGPSHFGFDDNTALGYSGEKVDV